MNSLSRKWIEAAKILGKDPNRKVCCPNCGYSYLVVEDREVEDWDNKIDRHLRCPSCDAENILTITKQ